MNELLKRVAESKKNCDEAALNEALIELGLQLETTFKNRLTANIAELKSSGYLKTVEDVEDVLNDAFFRIFTKIESYRGATDANAFGWTRRVVDSVLADKARKFLRRRAIWNAFLQSIPSNLRKYLETNDSSDD